MMAMLEPLSMESMTRILKTRDFPGNQFCNISNIPYAVGDEKDIEEFQANTTTT